MLARRDVMCVTAAASELRSPQPSYPTPLSLAQSQAPSLVLASAVSGLSKAQSQSGLDGGIVKAGYLFKQSSGVRKDWKPRWFFVRGGKLLYVHICVCMCVLYHV